MTHNDQNAQPDRTQTEEERQIAAQFAGLDNDLVQVEAPDGKPEPRDEILSDEDAEVSSDTSRQQR